MHAIFASRRAASRVRCRSAIAAAETSTACGFMGTHLISVSGDILGGSDWILVQATPGATLPMMLAGWRLATVCGSKRR